MKDKLGDAVDGDIPEADVYIALTFDDGPTGKKDGYPNGSTNAICWTVSSSARSRYVFDGRRACLRGIDAAAHGKRRP